MENNEDVNAGSNASESTQEVDIISEAASAHIEPDWKDLLRLEQERSSKMTEERDNYKEGMLAAKRREKARKEESAAEDGGDDKIAKAVRDALEPVLSTLQGSKVDQILASAVTDPSKREYVKSLYNNRIQRTGNSEDAIRSDIEAALALANASKFAKENEELKRMQDNRTYIPPNSGGGAAERGTQQKAHKWTPEQERSLEARAHANGIQDVEKYKELTWKQVSAGTAFEERKKYL